MGENEGDDGPGWPGPYGQGGPGAGRGRRRGPTVVYIVAAFLAAGAGAGLTAALTSHGTSPAASVSARDVPSTHNPLSSDVPLDQAAVERKVEPGLVDITAALKYQSETAEGTGMILSTAGLVLTNNHVIDGATTVQARLADGQGGTYSATVLGYDVQQDVALLKLSGASHLTTVSVGESSQVVTGTQVLALGDAQGRREITPSAGDISGLNQSIKATDEGSGTTEDLNNMLQTSAQIQQGDSGGALADGLGEVIGMVTAAKTGTAGQPSGTVGYAIPIDTAVGIAMKIASGKASAGISIGLPGFLGVDVAQSTSPSPRQQAIDARQPGIHQTAATCVPGGQEPGVPAKIAPAGTGALVLGIVCGGAAGSVLGPGDVITSVDGQRITTAGSLTTITAEYPPRTAVSVGWRAVNGARHTTRIVLGAGPARLAAVF